MPQGATVAVCAVLFTALVGWFLLPGQGDVPRDERPVTWPVERAAFLHEVLSKGTVESVENVEVKCEVRSMEYFWAEILQLPIPEGSLVEPGDVLATIDTAPLERLKTRYQILLNSREASLVQAEAQLEVSLAGRDEYIHGTFPQSQKALRMQVAASEESLRKAQRSHDYGKSMYREGFATQLGLDATELSVEKAQIDLNKDENALMVAELFNMPKMLRRYDSSITNWRASVETRDAVVQLTREKLTEIDEQIAKCVITAPSSGRLIYVHLHHNDHSHMIEEGSNVRQDQTMFALPNSDQMQVVVTITEDYISVIHPGMPAKLSFDAMPGVVLCGQVEEIAKMPKPQGHHFSGEGKEFETIVSIDSSSLAAEANLLRPGLTADIVIQVDNDPTKKELLLPTQAVFEHGEKTYCIVVDGPRWQAVELEAGRSNDVFVVVDRCDTPLEGLEVILGAAAYRDEVDLPEIEDEPAT